MIAPLIGLPKQSEVLIIIFLGISFLSLDFSLFQLKSNLEKVWDIELGKTKGLLESVIKYLIASIVLVRTFTLHVFLAFYVIMLWPAIFEEKPNLMIPWLMLGILRCLILNSITLVLGIFICHREKGFFNLICLEYVVAHIVEHGPSVYAWMSVLNFYRDLVMSQGSQQSSAESLYLVQTEEYLSEECLSLDKIKSHSASDINMDFLYSSNLRNLQGDQSIEDIIRELKDLFEKRRTVPDVSKSLDILTQGSNSSELHSAQSESVLEKAKRTLEISTVDILKAKNEKGRFAQALREISLKDLEGINYRLSSKKRFRVPKTSHSQPEEAKINKICRCYLKKQLEFEWSNQTLIEREIANITFNEETCPIVAEPSTGCRAIKTIEDLNGLREVGGFNPNIFLQKFVLKRNTSKNFGCQVSIFAQSGSHLVKKLLFLRNFGLS